MKAYILTKKGTKTPVRDWNENFEIYRLKSDAKNHLCAFGFNQIREVEIKVGKPIK